MEIPFKGQYTQLEFARAVQLANRSGGRSRFGGWMLVAALAAVIFLSGKSFFSESSSTGDPFIFIRIALAGLMLLAFLLFDPARAYLQTRRLWKNPAMQQQISGRVNHTGLVYTNVSPFRTVPWGRFARLRLNKDLASLLTADGVITVLPRRFFKSESDWQAFCKLAQSRLTTPR